jgi:hypothetical protein
MSIREFRVGDLEVTQVVLGKEPVWEVSTMDQWAHNNRPLHINEATAEKLYLVRDAAGPILSLEDRIASLEREVKLLHEVTK